MSNFGYDPKRETINVAPLGTKNVSDLSVKSDVATKAIVATVVGGTMPVAGAALSIGAKVKDFFKSKPIEASTNVKDSDTDTTAKTDYMFYIGVFVVVVIVVFLLLKMKGGASE